MGRQVFTAGEILTAANMNDLSDQTVMVFDDASARTTAIPSPVEGMLTYLESVGGPGGLEVFDGTDFVTASPPITREALPAGTVLQVVSSTTTTTTRTTSPNFQNTSLSASITPTSESSQVLVLAQFNILHIHTNGASVVTVFRGDVSGTELDAEGAVFLSANFTNEQLGSSLVLDSPSTTSATTYTLALRSQNTSNNAGVTGRQNMILMEVAG